MSKQAVRQATIVLILVSLVVWIGWDIYAVVTAGAVATESVVIRDASQVFEALAFGGGVVAGHWWISRNTGPAIARPKNFYVLGALGAIAAVVSVFFALPTSVFLGLGLIAGHLLWPLSGR